MNKSCGTVNMSYLIKEDSYKLLLKIKELTDANNCLSKVQNY